MCLVGSRRGLWLERTMQVVATKIKGVDLVVLMR